MDDDLKAPDWTMFIASAAHDMKNSVGMMSGVLENLLHDATIKETPAYQEIARLLYETGRLNGNLIQLLALYKEVGTSAYPFDVAAQVITNFVTEVTNRNKILIEAKGITFKAEFPADKVWYFDEDLVLGVINHAINNAIHYTKDKILLLVLERDGFLEIRIEDNGVGYPAVMLEASKASAIGLGAAVDFTTNSTGLGLYFSAEVAKMHKHRGRIGSMRLENGGTWGGGCFILNLP